MWTRPFLWPYNTYTFRRNKTFLTIVIATESTVSIMLILMSVLLLVCHGKSNASARVSVYVCCVVAVTKPNCPDGCLPLSCCMHLAVRSESIREMVAVCSCCSYLFHYYHWQAITIAHTHTQTRTPCDRNVCLDDSVSCIKRHGSAPNCIS